jgi:uracil-DNA glycosylase
LKHELDEIYHVLQKEVQKGKQIYPAFENIFRPFYETPLESVKVVIMGHEPYYNPGQANGLAFSVNRGLNIPPTLMNIYYELKNEIHDFIIPTHGDLTSWTKQGVLLLNCSLTVEKGRKITHEMVWKGLIKRVIKECSNKGGTIFVLWGKEAFNFDLYIDTSINTILKSSHPSPYSANKGPEKEKFFGCGHFKIINELLTTPINWNL